MKILSLDAQTDRLKGELDNSTDKVFSENVHSKTLGGENTFEFEMLANLKQAAYFSERSRVVIPSEVEGFEEFIVYQESQLGEEKVIMATAAYTEMEKSYILQPGVYVGTLRELANLVLPYTDYDLGKFESLKIKKAVITEHMGAYTFLKKLATLFELEMDFTAESDGHAFVSRLVHFVERIGPRLNKEIVYGVDLIGIDKIVHSERIVTELFCIGPERQDGTRLTAVVRDDAAFQRWNRKGKPIIGLYVPESAEENMTSTQLMQYGRTELNKRIASVVEYVVEAAEIGKYTQKGPKATLGATIHIKNPEFDPPLYADARIIQVDRSIDDQQNRRKVFHIGEVKTHELSDVKKTFLELQNQYNLRVIRSATKPPGDPNRIWIEIRQGFEVPHVWDAAANDWIAFAPTTAEQIGAETPEGAKDKADAAEGAAKEHANEIEKTLRTEIGTLSNALTEFETTIGETFKDGIISEAEAASIEKYKNSLDAAKVEVDNRYTSLYANPDLIGTPKTSLATAKTNFNTAHNALIKTINDAIADAKTTTEEKAAVDSAFVTYRTRLATLTTSFETATDSIAQRKATKAEEVAKGFAEDKKAEAIKFTETYANKKISQQPEPPANPTLNDLWIDNSDENLHVWKTWNGTTWKKATATDLSELDGVLKEAQIAVGLINTGHIADDAISAVKIQNEAVGVDKIGNGAITDTKLAELAVTAAKLAAGAVTDTKIAPNAVTGEKVASGAISELKIANNAVTTSKILESAITDAKIAAGAVTELKIGAGAVTNTRLAALAVDAAKLAANAVTDTKIATGAVTSGKLGELAVTAAKLASGAVIEDKLAANAVTNSKLAALAVDAAKLAEGAVTAVKVATGAITNVKLGNLAVDAAKLADNAVTSTKIIDDAISSAKIAAGAVTELKISDSAITNKKLSDLAVDAAKLATGAVIDTKLATGAVTNAKLAELAVDAAKLADSAVTSTKLANLAVGTAAIANGAITNAKIENLAVDTAKIKDASINSAKIANLAVGTAAIANAAITNAKIDSLDATKITTGRLDAARIQIGSGTQFADGFDPTKIEVGGRNFIINSSKEFRSSAVGTYTGALNLEASSIMLSDFNLSVGDTVTFKVYLDCTNNKLKGGRARISYYKPDNSYSAIVGNLIAIGQEGYSVVSWTVTAGHDRVVMLIQSSDTAVTTVEQIPYKNAKLEKGNKATDWTPAIEDTTAEIGAAVKPAADRLALWQYADTTFIDGGRLFANSVTANQIAAGTITATQIAANTITAAKIAANTITATEIAASTITAAEIKANSITATQIAANTITATQIAGKTVTAAEIKANAITASEIAANTITATQIAAKTLTAAEIVSGTITAASGIIADAAITTAKIANLAVGTAAIANGAITNAKIGALAVGTAEIASAAITSAKIGALAVGTAAIQDAAITNAKVGSLDATKITTGRLNADRIQIGSGTVFAAGFDPSAKATPEDIEAAKTKNHGYRYYQRIVVHGASTSLYYPVVIKGGDQNVKRDILIKRGYNEQAPPDWNTATHRGGLTVKLKANFGGWGGANYSWEVHELEEMYANTFAGATNTGNQTMFAIFLRGGGTTGAVYHIYSDQPLDANPYNSSGTVPASPQIATNQEIIFDYDHSNGNYYRVNAPAARSYTQAVKDEIALRNFVQLSQLSGDRLKLWQHADTTFINGGSIFTNSITANQIAVGAITANELAANSVTAAKIVANSITATQIAANTITASQMVANTITAASGIIADAAITTAKIANLSVDSGKIKDASITTAKIANLAVGNAAIANGAITNAKITDLDATKITAGTIAADRIGANSITALKIAGNTITAAEIAVGAITANELAANSITAVKILAGAVNADKIAANSISSNMIATIGLDAAVIKFGTMSGDRIIANSLSADRIKAGTLTGDMIKGGVIDGITFKSGTGTNRTFDLSGGTANFVETNVYGTSTIRTATDINIGGITVEEATNGVTSSTVSLYPGGVVAASQVGVSQYAHDKMKLNFGATSVQALAPNSVEVSGTTTESIFVSRRKLSIRANQQTLLIDTDTLRYNGSPIGFSGSEILWEGSTLLGSGDYVYPTRKLSDCPNGWKLVWSRYVNSTPANSDWNTTEILKSSAADGGGSWHKLVAANVSATVPPVADKYVYSTDTRLTGHARNISGTESGQALRRVIAF